MALFKKQANSEVDPFTDLLFNALLTITFLFLISLLLLNPPAKSGIIDPKAEFMITVSWPDGSENDIDVWTVGPDGTMVWYKRPQQGLMHLDRDDRGIANDTQTVDGKEVVSALNQEILSIRGRTPGEYIINIHYFKSVDKQATPVTIYFAEVNPVLKVLYYDTKELAQEGDEITAIRFSITEQGKVVNINQLQKSLVNLVNK